MSAIGNLECEICSNTVNSGANTETSQQKMKTNLKKKHLIHFFGECFIIQLRRGGGTASKINTNIHFPIDRLDVSCITLDPDVQQLGNSSLDEDSLLGIGKKSRYSLYAFCLQMGEKVCTGHYIVYAHLNHSLRTLKA